MKLKRGLARSEGLVLGTWLRFWGQKLLNPLDNFENLKASLDIVVSDSCQNKRSNVNGQKMG